MTVLFFLAAGCTGFVFAALAHAIRWRLPDRLWSLLPIATVAAVIAAIFIAGFERVWSRNASQADFNDLHNVLRVMFAIAFVLTTVSIHQRAVWVERDLLIESLVGMGTFVLCLIVQMVVALLWLSQAVIA